MPKHELDLDDLNLLEAMNLTHLTLITTTFYLTGYTI